MLSQFDDSILFDDRILFDRQYINCNDIDVEQRTAKGSNSRYQHKWEHKLLTVHHQRVRTEKVIKQLDAVKPNRALALAVSINSPGGLPVQSQIIATKLTRFAQKHSLKLFTFAKDVAASGGYLILSVGDHVSADRASIVGSIGVVTMKLKLQGLMDRLSLEEKHFFSRQYALYNAGTF